MDNSCLGKRPEVERVGIYSTPLLLGRPIGLKIFLILKSLLIINCEFINCTRARAYMESCSVVTPLTPKLIISRLAKILPAPMVAPMPTPSGAPTSPKMFHDKAENFAASRKNFTALQKNLTASRKCFTVGHYSCLFLGKRLLASPSALVSPLVSPLVRLSSQKRPLIFR